MTNETDPDSSLDQEIDEFALEVERTIQEKRERLEELPEFESKHRRIAETDPTELFS